MRRWTPAPVAALLALFALLLLTGTPAAAQTFPSFTGLVVDNANVLPPAVEASLTARLEALQKTTGRQLVVATIADVQGYALTDYGYKLGRTWGVGLRDTDNGAIIFVAPNNPPGQRGPRIEVGRRLEPILTDALSRTIIETRMMPRLRAGNDVVGALTAGTDAVIAQLSLPDADAKARAQAAATTFDKTHRRGAEGGGMPLGLIFWGLVLGFVLLSFLRNRGGKGRRHSGRQSGGGLPIILWGPGWGGDAGGGGGSSWGGGGGGSSSGSDGSWFGGGFTGGGGGDFGGGGASGDW